jgi:hypothetical protein
MAETALFILPVFGRADGVAEELRFFDSSPSLHRFVHNLFDGPGAIGPV